MTTTKQVVREIAELASKVQDTIDWIDILLEDMEAEKPLIIAHADQETGKKIGVKFDNVDDLANYLNSILQRGQNG